MNGEPIDVQRAETAFMDCIRRGDYAAGETIINQLEVAGEGPRISQLLDWMCRQPMQGETE